MKIVNAVLVALTLSLTACHTYAADLKSPGQIVTMMDRGDLSGAERAVKEVLAVKDTAKVHYILAQVYLKQGKRPEAQAELERANMMDPEHSYTDNAHYRPVADAIAGRVIKVDAGPVHITSTPVAAKAPEKPADYTPLWILFGVLALGGLGFLGWAWYDRWAKKKANAQELETAVSGLRSKVSLLVQDVQDAILKEKTSATSQPQRVQNLTLTQNKILALYEEVKSTRYANLLMVTSAESQYRSLKTALADIKVRDYNAKEEPKAKARRPDPGPIDFPAAPKAAPARRASTISAPTVHPTAPATSSTHETVVVNSGSNPVMDVVMVNMMLEESRRREREEEDRRERQLERERYDERRRAREREEERAREDSWSSSSRSSDSGSSSSWSSSSSSSDSGSNDSWSSSSSSSDSGSSSSSWD